MSRPQTYGTTIACQTMRSLLFPFMLCVICESSLMAERLPSKVSGTVVDEVGKPIPNASVELQRKKVDQDPSEVELPQFGVTVGTGITDRMGQFSIVPTSLVSTQGPIAAITTCRDYTTRTVVMTRPTGTSIVLRLRESVRRIQDVRDEADGTEAERLLVDLLKGDEKGIFRLSVIEDIYVHIGSVRPILMRIATNGEWEHLPKEGGASPAHRARLLLAYWGDDRDRDLLLNWWRERETSPRKHWKFPNQLHPDIERSEDLDEAIANWRKSIGMDTTGSVSTIIVDDDARALVKLIDFSQLDGPMRITHAVFVKRKESWGPLFHHLW